MVITVKVFATLRKNHPQKQELEVPIGVKADDVLKKMNINSSEVSIIMINGIRTRNNEPLKENDVVSFFPPVGGG